MCAILKYRSNATLMVACLLVLSLGAGCSSKDGGAGGSDSGLMKVTFSVPDMCCTSCAMKTTAALEQFDGVEKAYANFLEKQAWARYNPDLVDAERLRRSLTSLGFKEVTITSNEPYRPESLPTDL